MLALPEGFPQQPFQPVAYHGPAARFANRDAQSGVIKVVFGHIKSKQAIADAHIMGQYGLELLVAGKPLLLVEG